MLLIEATTGYMPCTLDSTRFLGEINELERFKFKFSEGHTLLTLWLSHHDQKLLGKKRVYLAYYVPIMVNH